MDFFSAIVAELAIDRLKANAELSPSPNIRTRSDCPWICFHELRIEEHVFEWGTPEDAERAFARFARLSVDLACRVAVVQGHGTVDWTQIVSFAAGRCTRMLDDSQDGWKVAGDTPFVWERGLVEKWLAAESDLDDPVERAALPPRTGTWSNPSSSATARLIPRS